MSERPVAKRVTEAELKTILRGKNLSENDLTKYLQLSRMVSGEVLIDGVLYKVSDHPRQFLQE